jgi:uncharacterized membrane protein
MSTSAAPVASTYAPPVSSGARASRITSLDIARGIVMILMAIDHVRVYSGIPAGGPSPGVFFTRWVTHFCAPAFAFLAGTGAFLYGQKIGDRRELARFLTIRGAMLVVLELTLIRFAWNFNFNYTQFTLAGVIWMLGWCMIILAGLVRVTDSPKMIGWIGVGIVMLQQIFGAIPRALPEGTRAAIAPIYDFIYPTGVERESAISVLYVIVPWIGVMAAGYGFGALMRREREERDRLLVRLGLGMTAVFVVVASILAVKNGGEKAPPFYVRLLNQQKYPASQLFLFMTLGPMIAFIPVAERMKGAFSRMIATIGRVPLAYYMMHIPLIHVSALAINAMRTGAANESWYTSAPYAQVPPDQRWPLWLLYAVWAIDIAILYVLCSRYAKVKAERPRAWMRYL